MPAPETDAKAASPQEVAAANTEFERQVLKEASARVTKTLNALAPALAMQSDQKAVKFLATWSVRLVVILAPVVLVLAVVNAYLAYKAVNVAREYFGFTPGLGVTPMVPMSVPYRTVAEVLDFGQKTMIRSFTLSFSNYRQELEDVRGRYTDAGFATFLKQLDDSGILTLVKDKRMNASISTGTPVLSASGLQDGFFVWLIVMPVELKLSGQETERTIKWKATLRVQRISTQQSIEALGVSQLVTAPM